MPRLNTSDFNQLHSGMGADSSGLMRRSAGSRLFTLCVMEKWEGLNWNGLLWRADVHCLFSCLYFLTHCTLAHRPATATQQVFLFMWEEERMWRESKEEQGGEKRERGMQNKREKGDEIEACAWKRVCPCWQHVTRYKSVCVRGSPSFSLCLLIFTRTMVFDGSCRLWMKSHLTPPPLPPHRCIVCHMKSGEVSRWRWWWISNDELGEGEKTDSDVSLKIEM